MTLTLGSLAKMVIEELTTIGPDISTMAMDMGKFTVPITGIGIGSQNGERVLTILIDNSELDASIRDDICSSLIDQLTWETIRSECYLDWELLSPEDQSTVERVWRDFLDKRFESDILLRILTGQPNRKPEQLPDPFADDEGETKPECPYNQSTVDSDAFGTEQVAGHPTESESVSNQVRGLKVKKRTIRRKC